MSFLPTSTNEKKKSVGSSFLPTSDEGKPAVSSSFLPTPDPTPAPKPVVASSTPSAGKPLSEQYFGTTTPSGAVLGYSYPETDTSGKPFFAYRKPGDTATTTDYRRVATSFDPRVAQPLTREQYYNPRASGLRDDLKDALGIAWNEELDHQIALALSGSNNPKNLDDIPKDKNRAYGVKEAALARDVALGKISILDAQTQMAKIKGIEVPYGALEKKGFMEKVKDFFTPPPGKSKATQSPLPSLAPKKAEAATTSSFLPVPDAPITYDPNKPRVDLGTSTLGMPGPSNSSTPSSIKTGSTVQDIKDAFKYLFDPKAEIKQARPTFATPEEAKILDKNPLKGPRAITGFLKITSEIVNRLPEMVIQGAIEASSAAHQFKGDDGRLTLPVNPERLGFPKSRLDGNTIKTLGETTIARATELDEERPNTKTLNSLQAYTEHILPAIFSVMVLGDAASSATKLMLSWTKSAPNLGISASRLRALSPDDAMTEVVNRANQRAREIIAANTGADGKITAAGMRQLSTIQGEINTLATGLRESTLPQLNAAGQLLDDISIKLNQDLGSFGSNASRLLESTGPTASKVKPTVGALPGSTVQAPVGALAESKGALPAKTPEGDAIIYKSSGGEKSAAAKSGFPTVGEGTYYARTAESSKQFGDDTVAYVLPKDAKIYDASKAGYDLSTDPLYREALKAKQDFTTYAKSKGFDYIEFASDDGATTWLAQTKGTPALKPYATTPSVPAVKPPTPTASVAPVTPAAPAVESAASSVAKDLSVFTPKEVQKYSSVDDFLNAQPKLLENGKGTVEVVGKDVPALGSGASDLYLAPNANVKTLPAGTPVSSFSSSDIAAFKGDGFDVIQSGSGSTKQVKILSPKSVLSKSELTDIYERLYGQKTAFSKAESVISEKFDISTEEANKVMRMMFDEKEVAFATKKNLIETGDPGLYAVGKFSKVPDIFSNNFKNLIEVVESGGKVPSRVVMHEAFHAYISSFVSDAERTIIINRVKKNLLARPRQALYDRDTYKTAEQRAEEWLADDFAEFVKNLAGGKDTSKNPFKAFFMRIIQKLRSIMRKAMKLDDLYRDILNKKRGGTPSPKPKAKPKFSAVEGGEEGSTRMKKFIDEAQEKLLDERKQADRMRQLLAEAKRKPNEPESLFQKLKRSLNPLKEQDNVTKELWRDWKTDLYLAKENAELELKKFDKPEFDEMPAIHAYQDGKESAYNTQVKEIFDSMFNEANRRGLEVPYRSNYLPQVYANSKDEVISAAIDYLRDLGMEEFMIQEYVNGKRELPAAIAQTLKLHPDFEKSRLFPDYKTAEKYGLTPRYKNIPALAAHYRQELEKAVANKKFIEGLAKEGKIFPTAIAPMHWKELTPSFSPKGYKAAPKLAEIINSQFRDESSLSFGPAIAKAVANLSKTAQEIALSAGFPKSNVNFFSIGQLIKQMTAGDFKAAIPFARANFNGPSLKYFDNNQDVIRRMADEGLDLGNRIGMYSDTYKNVASSNIWQKVLGKTKETFDNLFNEKTFGSFMPQMYIQTFKDVEAAAIKKGIEAKTAQKLAADTVKAMFGLVENTGRSKTTQDVLSSVFFAPKFREGLINTFINAGKAFTTEFKNPAFKMNRRLIVGMILSYLAYDYANQKLNDGKHIWENEPGRQFALKIPLPDGQFAYVEFMPSSLAFVRNMIQGGIATVTGDTATAGQKFGSLFSMPIKIATEVITNRDYFGREIYGDEDNVFQKALKISKYTGLQVNHPYIKELINQLQDKKPLYQSVVSALEFPVKFSSQDSIDKNEFYRMLDARDKDRAKRTAKFKPVYEEISELIKNGEDDEAQKRVDALSEEEYEIYKSLKAADKRRDSTAARAKMYQTVKQVQELDAEGKSEEAQAIVDKLSDEEYRLYKSVRDTIK